MNNSFNRNAGSAENGNGRGGAYRNGRVPPRVERGRRGRGGMQAPRIVPHVAIQAPIHFVAGAPVPIVFPGMPPLGAPVHAVHVGPPLDGGQLHDIAHNPPMFLPHPGVVNAVVVPHPAVYVAGVVDGAQPMHQIAGQPPHVVGEPHVGANQQGIGAQPRNQGAGQPPHVVGLPNVGADQQGRGIREVMSEMLKHLLEVENRYLSLHALLIADGEPVPADAVIEPNAFQMVNNTERLEQRDVERYRVLLSETYARFAREDSMLVGFMRAVFEMHARFLFLLDVHMNARNRAA